MIDPDSFEMLAAERRSVRAYLEQPVSPSLLRQLLEQARLAPSGSNLQPGSVIAVQGEVRRKLCDALCQAWREDGPEVDDEEYFAKPMPMTLRRRQTAAAQALYGALGIMRGDRAGRDAQFERNFRFFDAPVALIVTIDRGFGSTGYVDLGMFLHGFMLAAQAQGLSSCCIGAMASYSSLIRRHLELDEQSKIVCGLALGYADPAARVNQTRTDRCALDDYFRVAG